MGQNHSQEKHQVAPSGSGPCPDCLWLQAGGECTAIRIEEGPGRWVVASQPCLMPGQCQYYQSVTEVCDEITLS